MFISSRYASVTFLVVGTQGGYNDSLTLSRNKLNEMKVSSMYSSFRCGVQPRRDIGSVMDQLSNAWGLFNGM